MISKHSQTPKPWPSSTAIFCFLRPFILFFALALSITTLSRLLLLMWQSERLPHLSDILTILGFGLRIDLSTLCFMSVPALLIALVIPFNGQLGRVRTTLLTIWLSVCVLIIGFMEMATPGFVQEYDLRPNRLFVEYLEFPDEVFSMLLGGFKTELFFVFVGLAGLVWLIRKTLFSSQYLTLNMHLHPLWRILVGVMLFFFVALGARGTLDHRPINPSYTAFTDDPLLNSLTLNSIYSVLFAVKAMQDEISATQLYPKLPDEDVFRIVRESSGIKSSAFVADPTSTWHTQAASSTALPRYKNLVIILQESLGAQFVGTLGGQQLTPEIDALAADGWLFENLYATGTRSVRGIEAVVTGFVPTPARSVVKLPKSQRNFFSLASALKEKGYDTSFIYGGEGHFDNMAGFFLGNGFQRVVDRRYYENPKFEGSWGVSDEDLLNRANHEFEQLHQANTPFFSLVFSSSNHTPYDFPVDDGVGYTQPINTRDNAIRYADHAVGEFFKQAKNSSYWQDTLFLIVADHDARVYGQSLVPIEHFRIPGVLIGQGLPARRDARIFSQIDLGPTLLSLLGAHVNHPMIGKDITALPDDYVGRAVMQYERNQAYMEGDQVVVLQPQKDPKQFRYEPTSHQLSPADLNPKLADKAIAHALWGSKVYSQGLYAPPKSSVALASALTAEPAATVAPVVY